MKSHVQDCFQRLKPLCVALARQFSTKCMQTLHQECLNIDRFSLCQLQEYVIFPIRLRLISETNDNVIIDCVKFLSMIFSTTTITSWHMFTDIIGLLFRYFPFPEKVSSTQHHCEELMLCVCECVETMAVKSTDEIHSQIFSDEFCLPLAQYIYSLLEVVKQENSKPLRLASVSALSAFVYCSESIERTETVTLLAGNRLAAFLPGVSTALHRTICGDVKQGHRITVMSLNLFATFISMVIGDKNIMVVGDERCVNGFDDQKRIPCVKRTENWVSETAKKLEIIIQNIAKMVVTHEHWKVRMALAKCSGHILSSCGTNLYSSISPLLQILFALSVDSYKLVANASQSMIDELSRNMIHVKSFNAILEEDVFFISSKLVKIHLTTNDDEKLAVLKTAVGYLRLLGMTVNNSLNSLPHLERFLKSMLNFTRFECSNFSFFEENLPSLDFDKCLPQLWPKKRFKHFENEEIVLQIQRICGILGCNGNILLLTDHLLERLDSPYKNEAIFLLTNVVAGLDEDTCASIGICPNSDNSKRKEHIVTVILETLLLPKYWEISSLYRNENLSENDQENHNQIVLQLFLSLETISVCSQVLKHDFRVLLIHVLSPVIAKAGASNLAISQAGKLALRVIAHSCKYNSITHLITSNSDYLINSISSGFKCIPECSETAIVLQAILQHCDADVLPIFKDSVYQLLHMLDTNQEKALLVMPVLQSVVTAVQKWYSFDLSGKAKLKEQSKEIVRNNFKASLLERHHLRQVENSFMDPEVDLSEEKEASSVTCIDDDDDDSKDNESLSLHVQIVSDILERCVHMLSSRNLQLCVLTFDVITTSILALRNESDKILPYVHKIWFPLVSRFSDDFVVNIKAFETLSVIADECGDFVKARTMKDLWPKIMFFLRTQAAVSKSQSKSTNYQMTSAYKYQFLILSKVGRLASKLELTEKEFELLANHCLLYVNKSQPFSLQKAASESLDYLSSSDSDALWFHYNELYGDKEIRSDHQSLETVHFTVSDSSAVTYHPCL